MKKCAVLCAVLALLGARPALAEFYAGIEARTQEAELELEAFASPGGPTKAEAEAAMDESIGRNSINAIRVGYIAEIGSDLFLDASIAVGNIKSSRTTKFVGPAPAFGLAAGEEGIMGESLQDGAFYIDFGAGVEGQAGSISYTGGMRIELSTIEEDTWQDATGVETTELKQRNIVFEGTVGVGTEVRGFVGVGLNFYSGEETETDHGVTGDVVEFKYDLPLVIFAGIESKGERVNAFAQVSLIGEKFLSTRAGVAVKF
ncbi:MAG: hypothetical protein ACYSU0_13350 [Planctomycetota bacterium]|jgi:hypothetical protein